MFGFGKKESYEDRIKRAVAEKKEADVATTAREAFADKAANEDTLAWIAAAIYERHITPALEYLPAFVERFPTSLHLVRVYFADILARSSQFDGATHHARIYLRLVRDRGLFKDLHKLRIIREGVSRAFLLVTAAYTELGARSYSIRALKQGLRLGLVPRWEEIIQKELLRLEQELANAQMASIDKEWESFFSNGKWADKLYKMCEANNYPDLAKRIDLLEGNFRFNSKFIVGEDELFMLIFAKENNAFLLQ